MHSIKVRRKEVSVDNIMGKDVIKEGKKERKEKGGNDGVENANKGSKEKSSSKTCG